MPHKLLDDYLAEYDAIERHQTNIAASSEAVWEALQRADFSRSATIRWLLWLRGMGARRPAALTLATFQSRGFAILEERPPDHVVLGLIGRFWTPTGQLVSVDRESFLGKPPEGTARAAWSFELEPLGGGATLLATETRVQASDEQSRRSFKRYWRLVGPFSALIRREMLGQVRREAMSRL